MQYLLFKKIQKKYIPKNIDFKNQKLKGVSIIESLVAIMLINISFGAFIMLLMQMNTGKTSVKVEMMEKAQLQLDNFRFGNSSIINVKPFKIQINEKQFSEKLKWIEVNITDPLDATNTITIDELIYVSNSF